MSMIHTKVFVVTGGTDGIGLQIAIVLAKQGFGVVIIGSCIFRGRAAVNRITSVSTNSYVEFLCCDLSSFRESIKIGTELRARKFTMLGLVNNASGLFQDVLLNDAGLEKTFALSFCAPLILSTLLCNKISEADGVIINVCSDSVRHTVIKGEDVIDKSNPNPLVRYAQAKIMLLHGTKLLEKQWEGKVSIFAVSPKGAYTTIYDKVDMSKQPYLLRIIFPFIKHWLKRTSAYEAAVPLVKALLENLPQPDHYLDSHGKWRKLPLVEEASSGRVLQKTTDILRCWSIDIGETSSGA